MAPDASSATAPETATPPPELETRDPPASRGEPAGPRVLVVDDNDELRAALAAGLSDEGLSVATAAGAADAAALVAAHRFDAAVIDLVMPGQHGLAVLADLQSMENGRRLPAVILSGLPAGETRTQARKLVAKLPNAAFLDKPVTPRRLLITLGRLLAVR